MLTTIRNIFGPADTNARRSPTGGTYLGASSQGEGGDPRLGFMDALLSSPHGDLAGYGEVHERVLEADPEFYGHMAAWYHGRGAIRDQRLLFVAHLGTSPQVEHREAAFIMAQALRTYELARMLRYLKEQRHRLPRRTRSAVAYWLRRREADPAWFDEVALRDRRNLKYLYATLRLRPAARAGAILFERRPPPESRLAAVKRLATCDDTLEVARGIVAHRIFFSTAVGLLKKLDAPALAALVDVMSPQQLLNSLAALQRRGALDNPELRALVEAKLAQARDESRVQDARTLRAAAACGDRAIAATLGEIGAERLRRRGRITRPTALFVDKSGSMELALEVGAHVAALCSTLAEGGLWAYAFDSIGRRVGAPTQGDLLSWRQAFSHLQANGATSIGAPFVNMERNAVRAEQIVVITDGAENTSPLFVDALRDYEAWSGHRCGVVVVLVGVPPGRQSGLERSLMQAGIDHSSYRFDGDLYSLPNLAAYLATPRRAELCAEVMETTLPCYADLERLPPGFDPETCELL